MMLSKSRLLREFEAQAGRVIDVDAIQANARKAVSQPVQGGVEAQQTVRLTLDRSYSRDQRSTSDGAGHRQ